MNDQRPARLQAAQYERRATPVAENRAHSTSAATAKVARTSQARKTISLNLHLPHLRLPQQWPHKLRFIPEFFNEKRRWTISSFFAKTKVRIALIIVIAALIAGDVFPALQSKIVGHTYALGSAGSLLTPTNQAMADKVQLDSKQGVYNFNAGFNPAATDMTTTLGPQITAAAPQDASQGIKVTDPSSQISFTLTPQFGLWQGQQDGNRVVYPLTDGSGWIVYTMHGIGVKEDLLLNHATGNQRVFNYKLGLGDGLAAKIEKDGSIGVYGSTLLSGNVATDSSKDAALLQKARDKAPKTTLLFTVPTPTITEADKAKSGVAAAYSIQGDNLRVTVNGLQKAHYPLTVDPSIYVESAEKFMRGNNETNVNFDVADSLIQKGKTTGARIDDWSSTNDLSTPIWGQGTAVAGGYIYSAGGTQGTSPGSATFYTAGTSTFNVPTGVTSITVKAWGGGGGGAAGNNGGGIGGDGGGGGYAKAVLTVTPGESLSVLVGSGGAKAAANLGGADGGGYSALTRSSTFLLQAGGGGGGGGSRGTSTGNGGDGGGGGGASGVNGFVGSGSGAAGGGGRGTNTAAGAGGSNGSGGTTGSVGAANAGGNGAGFAGNNCSTAVTNTQSGSGGSGNGGGGGGATSTCSNGGGGGGGLFGGGGGGSISTNSRGGGGGGGGSDLVTGTGTVETAGGVITAGNNGDSDRNNAGTGGAGGARAVSANTGNAGAVIISYTIGSAAISSTVSWAKFNPTTNAIESPDPGTGTCSGWCTNSAYNLPVALKDLSLVAYNGFLYAIGGANSNGTAQSNVYIAKIGANGEPQLWHPSGGTPVYWYSDTALSAARSKFAAVAYNNRMYILGGLTGAGSPSTTVLSSNTVQYANINPTGTLTTWTSTGMAALTTARYGLSAQVYNDVLYVMGGDATFTGTPVSTAEYAHLNSDGTMNSWVTTSSLITSGRMTMGGSFSAIWGGYIYVGGGCTALNASGYCTAMASDMQLASINADGSLDTWNTILGITNQRVGHTLIAWQNGLYRLGGCRAQDPSTGACTDTIFDVDYGVINQDGDASTVSESNPSGSGNCAGANPYQCDLPSTSNIGEALNATAITNGYLYVIGGCTSIACSAMSTHVVYSAIASDGSLVTPTTCTSGTFSGSWCIDSTHTISGGIGAAGVAVFGSRIYLVGGLTGSANKNTINYVAVNTDGTLNAWTSQSLTGAGATNVSYEFAYTRANPSSAGTNPGNLYIFGGCSTSNAAGCTAYSAADYKCNIGTTGAIAGCTTTGQLQIGIIPGDTQAGLGIMSGTVYANYIYLIGGVSPNQTDLKTVRYAKLDNSNNIVSADGSGAWVESPNQMNVGRRRAAAFGYNGYIYVVGGYDGTGGGGILADIEFVKVNVSDGSLGSGSSGFNVSSVEIGARWGLSVPVSNSFAYVIGGCDTGQSPTCGSLDTTINTFQIYNNDSGTPAGYSTSANTYGTSPSRIGASSTILNGYLYVAGGCTSVTDCTTAINTVSYAPIDANGNLGSWSNTTANLPAVRTWGKLEAAGGTLYYIGGQDSTATNEQSTVYYGTPSSGDVTSWGTATNGLPAARTKFGAAVWNNRLYVVGGLDGSATDTATIYASPQLNSGGNITSAWSTGSTSLSVARYGAMVVAYANNLYVFGGNDGTNYLSDGQYAQISTTNGNSGSWTYTTSLPTALAQGDSFAANGYMYITGGRSSATSCRPISLVAPISANTSIASGNNPTGIGEWYETNSRYTGDRYGNGASYYNGKVYVTGGGCGSTLTYASPVAQQTALLSQPQVAKYSIMIDTDTDVFPSKWLMNGLDNSVGASWQLKYRSMTNTSTLCTSPAMTTWGQETNAGNVTLGTPGTYVPKDGSGTNTNCARFFYLAVSIDSSQTFGYPEDISRGPTITDLTLEFTADPSKHLMHGRTFLGGQQQPDDTPF